VDKYANMTCVSDTVNEIAWTYDGNSEINPPCSSSSPNVFVAKPMGNQQCDIAASLADAAMNANIQSISGPYGCTDRRSAGVTATSLVIVLGTFRHFLR